MLVLDEKSQNQIHQIVNYVNKKTLTTLAKKSQDKDSLQKTYQIFYPGKLNIINILYEGKLVEQIKIKNKTNHMLFYVAPENNKNLNQHLDNIIKTIKELEEEQADEHRYDTFWENF